MFGYYLEAVSKISFVFCNIKINLAFKLNVGKISPEMIGED